MLWAVFTIRPLIKSSHLKQYAELVGKSIDERRAITYGKDLYKFLEYAKGEMPESATYAFEGFEEGSVDIVRAEYYLFPRTHAKDPQFILECGKDGYSLRKR
jgi:hypothetical protein